MKTEYDRGEGDDRRARTGPDVEDGIVRYKWTQPLAEFGQHGCAFTAESIDQVPVALSEPICSDSI